MNEKKAKFNISGDDLLVSLKRPVISPCPDGKKTNCKYAILIWAIPIFVALITYILSK